MRRGTILMIAVLGSMAARRAAGDGLSLEALPADSAVRATLYWENDGGPVKRWDSQDRHYTAGVGASVQWRAPWVDDLARQFPSFFGEFNRAETAGAMGLAGTLTIFTPENIASGQPIASDRPYAGWTYLGLLFQRALRNGNRYTDVSGIASLFDAGSYSRYESVELDLGIMGPSSLAQNAQEMIHHALDYTYPQGWNYQVHDEVEFSIKYNRRWRSKEILLSEGGHGFDILPEAGITAGSLLDEARIGIMLRFGLLPDDFGPGELANPGDFTRPGADDPPYDLYVFARPYGRFVAHNALLQGTNWRNSDPVTQSPEPFVFCTQFGFGFRIMRCLDLTYSVTYQSPEFQGQSSWDCWASLNLSFTVAW
jgi:hypothetical protein